MYSRTSSRLSHGVTALPTRSTTYLFLVMLFTTANLILLHDNSPLTIINSTIYTFTVISTYKMALVTISSSFLLLCVLLGRSATVYAFVSQSPSPASFSLPGLRLRPTYRRPDHHRTFAVEGDFDADSISRSVEESKAGSFKARLRALYKFSRPHTIRGTVMASIAGTTRALIDTPNSLSSVQWGLLLPRAFLGMLALLLGNAFIVGINQIFDEDIDKLNKPFLPVASGEMSKKFAWTTVLLSGLMGPVIVYVPCSIKK